MTGCLGRAPVFHLIPSLDVNLTLFARAASIINPLCLGRQCIPYNIPRNYLTRCHIELRRMLSMSIPHSSCSGIIKSHNHHAIPPRHKICIRISIYTPPGHSIDPPTPAHNASRRLHNTRNRLPRHNRIPAQTAQRTPKPPTGTRSRHDRQSAGRGNGR